MLSLYELSNSYRELLAAIDGGEIPEEALCDTLDAMEGAFEEKAEAVACLIKSMTAEAAAIDVEARKLLERGRARENCCRRLRAYLLRAMDAVGKTRLETARAGIVVRKPRKAVRVEPEFVAWAQECGRDDLLRYTPPAPDKTAIAAALRDGGLPFVSLADGERSVMIR